MSDIKLEHLSFSHKKKKSELIVLNDLTAFFESEKISVIVGPSGCGKSTLLRCICGLYDYQGNILFDDINVNDLPVQSRDIAYINQNYALYPHFNIFDSISYPLKIAKAPISEIRERVYKISEELGIKDILTRKPNQISGGQAQRAALARALVKRANIILFDEPLSNIDEQHRNEIRILIKKLCHKYNATALYVTHDLTEALILADKIYLMMDGKFEFEGTPNQVLRSRNKKVKDFFVKNEIRL